MESKRRRVVSCVEEDRISNLQEHLMDSILKRVPIEDAVRTSILSRKWRHTWTNMRALVFDKHFSKKIAKNGAFGRNGFIRIINQVLFLHNGPILTFLLHIPDNIRRDYFPEFDQWMHFLSRNGVTEIVLTNLNPLYKFPCYMFCCRELRKLELENSLFEPPLEFEGFPNLEDLQLRYIVFGDNSSGTQINLPKLKILHLLQCTNIYNFNIKATELETLFVINHADATLLRLLHSPCLTDVAMWLKFPIYSNPNQRYELPSYVFSCHKLRFLKLENCFIKRPLEFKGFLNLEELYLQDIDFGANLSGTQISLPELKKLYLVTCTNVNNFNFTATKLEYLLVFGCPDAMFLRLLHSPCLTQVGMCVQNPIQDNIRVERITFVAMLINFPKIEALTVDGLFFKVVIAEKIPKWLPCAVNSLKRVCLIGFEVGDLDQLEGALCLIRNSPNLESLSLTMESQVINRYDVGPAVDHLESPNCLDCTLNKLQTVEIIDLYGSRPELLFIELILAHSPSLNKFTIRPSEDSDAKKIIDILKDVIQFPRVSPKARILFLDPKT